jgi:RNA polymerase sigma factor (sigma-70 family)
MDETPSTRASLLVRLRDPRDERAWSEFVDIYTPLVYRLARRRGLQNADAIDLTQEVFRAVASAIDRFDPDPSRGTFRAWLSRIARNLTINALAARDRQVRGTGDTAVARLIDELPASTDDEPSAEFDLEYRRRLFDWAADRVRAEVSETEWRAFYLTGVEGREPRDVAAMLATSIGTVYSYKSRVMARLRRLIEQVDDPG